jgi:sigma-54 dependent transcriptional regulator, acetoin dehydrogenase operon transcriptional activator AcoR
MAELTELKARLSQAIPDPDRAAAELRAGFLELRAGELEEALGHLGAARKGFERQRDPRGAAQADMYLGTVLSLKGEHERARSLFERAAAAAAVEADPGLRARIANCMAEAAERAGDRDRALACWNRARAHFEAHWDGGELSRVYAGLAVDLAEAGQLEAAERLSEKALGEAEASGDPLWLGRALLASGAVRWKVGDLRSAKRFFRRAINVLGEHGLRRDLAEAYLAYGLLIGDASETTPDVISDAPAFYLTKAQELYRDLGGLRDLERVRDAFRRFGRRVTDKLAELQVVQLLAELKQNREATHRQTRRLVELALRAAASDAATHKLLVDEERQLGLDGQRMAQTEERFLGALNALILERENIRTLLDVCRALSTIQDPSRLHADIAKMAAQLTGADRAAVALIDDEPDRDVAPRLRGAVRLGPEDSVWMQPVAQVTQPGANPMMFGTQEAPPPVAPAAPGPASTGVPLSTDEVFLAEAAATERRPQLGRALACPLRHGSSGFGAIYCDKELSGGLFTERDLDLLAIFATQVGTILENSRVADEGRRSARTRAATLEAISDAVFTLGPGARVTVTAVNAAAKRIASAAGLDAAAPVPLGSWPELGFLAPQLERGEELDGRVVRMASGEFLLNTRCVHGDAGEIVGLVATLTEMKRATSLAQRIVGSTARFTFADIIGKAPNLRRRLQLAEAAARSDSSVLITGESGTGKELVAQAIHNAGARAGGPFVGINCAAIPRELLESELFGYEAGAFTGAKKGGHPGKLELAEGGTVLLDEIGDMPLEMQAKLLRVLQEKRIQRLGSTRETSLDARLIATTNRDLAEEVERGRFRRDLFFRLRVIHIELPPLRERVEDIPMLVEHFLELFSARLGKMVRGVVPEVMQVLTEYPWPGNVRELEHVLEGEVNLATPGQELLGEVPVMLESSQRRRARAAPVAPPVLATIATGPEGLPFGAAEAREVQPIAEVERQLLVQALAKHRGSVPDVARSLGVSRGTVYNKMRKFQIDPTGYRGG